MLPKERCCICVFLRCLHLKWETSKGRTKGPSSRFHWSRGQQETWTPRCVDIDVCVSQISPSLAPEFIIDIKKLFLASISNRSGVILLNSSKLILMTFPCSVSSSWTHKSQPIFQNVFKWLSTAADTCNRMSACMYRIKMLLWSHSWKLSSGFYVNRLWLSNLEPDHSSTASCYSCYSKLYMQILLRRTYRCVTQLPKTTTIPVRQCPGCVSKTCVSEHFDCR